MTILVTGGAGYIGSHMVFNLTDSGERVVVLDNLSTGFRAAVAEAVPLVIGDTGNESLVQDLIATHGVDTIIHFAASIVVPESVANPLAYYKNNTANSRSLIETAIKSGVRNFIFSSTAAVYGNPETIPVCEDAPTIPMSPYGASKLMTEIMLRDAAFASDLKYVVLRYFNVAGADPKLRTGQSTPAATHLIKVAVQAALGLRPQLEIFGTDYPTKDGTCVRDYIHVTDLISAHQVALSHLCNGGDSATFNCGYGSGYSVLEVIESVKRVSGVDFATVKNDRRAGDPAVIVAEASRIREQLGWHPEYADLDTIVTHALAWENRLSRVSQFQGRGLILA